MNIPLPPTDNLYKFLAIFGLIVALLSFLFFQILIFDLETQAIRLQGEVVSLEEDTITYDRGSKPKNTAADENQLRYRIAEIKGKTAVIKEQIIQIKVLDILSLRGVVIGVVIMIIGFLLWYLKLQKYQDRILKEDAEQHRTRRSVRTRKNGAPVSPRRAQ